MQETKPSSWMRHVLLIAAVCNVTLGSWMAIWPGAAFAGLGLVPPHYPEIWQGLGVMLGVYGAGYGMAAVNPLRHWPITAAGLLTNVLAPIGLLHAVSSGRLPWRVGWALTVADLIWSIPLALILKGSYDNHLRRLRTCSPEVLSFALRARTSNGLSIDQLSRRSPVLLVFLRHAGCTFCREALADISAQRSRIEAAGAEIVLVHLGDADCGRDVFSRYRLDDVLHISDPSAALYRAFGLPRGTLRMLFGPATWWRGIQAGIVNRHGIGRPAGDGFQMPGIFLVFHGHILRSYRHQSASDRPDYTRFVQGDESVPDAVPVRNNRR